MRRNNALMRRSLVLAGSLWFVLTGTAQAAVAQASGQTKQGAASSSATSLQITFPQNVVSGNTVVCGAKYRNGTPSFSDSLGNTWATDINDPNNDMGTMIGSIKSITNAGSMTVTFGTTTSATKIGLSCMEYSGFTGGAALDQSNTSTGSGTAFSSGSVTTTAANELLFCAVSDSFNGTPYSWTSSFTLLTEGASGTSRASFADRIVTSTGTYTATATMSSTANYRSTIATYKEVGGGGAARRVFVVH